MTDPWLPPAQQHPAQPAPASYAPPHPAPAYPAQQQAPTYPVPQQPTGGFAFPAPPVAAPRRTSGVAVAALVLSILSLLGVVGVFLMVVGQGAAAGFADGFTDAMDGEYTLEGTLPQAEIGRTYTGQEVQAVVEDVLDRDWSTYEDLRCQTLTYDVGATTSCTGIVDDYDTDLEIAVDDEVGGFTLTQYW